MIMIISWAIGNNLVYLRTFLVGFMIVSLFERYSSWSIIVIVFWSYPLVGS